MRRRQNSINIQERSVQCMYLGCYDMGQEVIIDYIGSTGPQEGEWESG